MPFPLICSPLFSSKDRNGCAPEMHPAEFDALVDRLTLPDMPRPSKNLIYESKNMPRIIIV